jgi:hypothetical protein
MICAKPITEKAEVLFPNLIIFWSYFYEINLFSQGLITFTFSLFYHITPNILDFYYILSYMQ